MWTILVVSKAHGLNLIEDTSAKIVKIFPFKEEIALDKKIQSKRRKFPNDYTMPIKR